MISTVVKHAVLGYKFVLQLFKGVATLQHLSCIDAGTVS